MIFSSLTYSFLLSPSNIGDYSNCGENRQWGEKGWVMQGVNGEHWVYRYQQGVYRYQVHLCACVYVSQFRAEKPEVSFSTACNPIRRITLLSQAI